MSLSATIAQEVFTVAGVGVVGPFGTGRTVFRERAEECAYSDKGEGRDDCLVRCGNTGAIQSANTDKLHDFIAPHKLRRTDHFSRLALTAAYLALENAGLKPIDFKESGLLVATGYGPLASTCSFKDTFFDNGSLGASPTMFTKSVHNQAASHLALHLGLCGPVATICQHSLPFQQALLTAWLWLREKRVKRVLVGGVDEMTPFLDYCHGRYLQEDKGDVPLFAKPGYIPGEGAAFFVLEAGKEDNLLPILGLPIVGNILSEGSYPLSRKACCVVNGLDLKTNYWQKNSTPRLSLFDFRKFYGYFPSAAALDLAALTSLLPDYGAGSVFATGSGRYYSRLRLFKPGSYK